MSDLVKSHFSQIDHEDNIRWNGNRFVVMGDVDDVPDSMVPEDEVINAPHHINYFTFRALLKCIQHIENPEIVETGTTATAVRSSALFDQYTLQKGGKFTTVDLNPATSARAQAAFKNPMSSAHTSDSVQFLKDYAGMIDVLYLDSYDVDWMDPINSGNHCVNELEAALPKMKDHSFILIDDTPSKPLYLPFRGKMYEDVKASYDMTGMMPGKGMFIEDIIMNNKFGFKVKKVIHQYQVLYELNRANSIHQL